MLLPAMGRIYTAMRAASLLVGKLTRVAAKAVKSLLG